MSRNNKIPAWNIRRHQLIPNDVKKLWRSHARQAGEIITAWNDLRASCYSIFEELFKTDNLNLPHCIWNSSPTDNHQRGMLLATARAVLTPKSPIYEEIKWLKDRTDEMAKHRNDPAHTPIAFGIYEPRKPVIVPNIWIAKEEAAKRLTDRPLDESWRETRDDLFVLATFAQYVALAIRYEHSPLPHRPELRSLPAHHPKKGRTRRTREKPLTPL